jgi:outer membrane biosynthesis protein TonB
VFWSRSRVFRATLLISLGLHAIFLVQVKGRGTDGAGREEILSFTFVQGGEATEKRLPEERVGTAPGLSEAPEETPAEASEADRKGASSPVDEKPTPQESPRVDKELPRIEDASLLDFSAHPLAESYRRQLQRLIRQYQTKPPEELKEGFEGRVKVWFNVSREGKLNPPVFVDGKVRSSREMVNKAAMDSVVAAAAHFPPFPEGVKRAEIWFYVHVDFGSVRYSGD